MAEVDAELRLGEGGRVAPIAHMAIGGPGYLVIAGLIGVVAGMTIAPMIGTFIIMAISRLSFEAGQHAVMFWVRSSPSFPVIGGLLGWVIASDIMVRRHYRKYMAGLKARGSPDVLSFTYRVQDQGLDVRSTRMSHYIPWPALIDIIPSPSHWLFQSDSISIILPRKAFAAPEQEKAFMAAVVAHLTPETRARAKGAVRFAETGAEPKHSRFARRVSAAFASKR